MRTWAQQKNRSHAPVVEESLEALSGGTRPQLSALIDVTSPTSGVALLQVHALRHEAFEV